MNVIRVINQRECPCRIEVAVKKENKSNKRIKPRKINPRTQTTQFVYQVLNCEFLKRYWSSITKKRDSDR